MTEETREKTLGRKRVYSGRILDLRVDDVELPDGKRTIREVVEHKAAVGILPVLNDGTILLVRQHRYAVGEDMLEIPAGIVEGEEPFEDAARRELQEEIGYFPGKLKEIGRVFNSPGFCTELMVLFLATDLRPSKLQQDDDEFISVVSVAPGEIAELLSGGTLRDSKTFGALSWWKAFGEHQTN